MGTIDSLEAHDLEVLAVAYLSSQSLSTEDALKILRENGISMSEPTYSRRLGEAEKKRWLVHIIAEDLFSADVMREVRQMTCRRDLEESLKELCPPLKNVAVYSSGSDETSPEKWETRLNHHAHLASRRIHGLLRDAENVVIGWGHQIDSIVYALERMHPKPFSHPLTFIPSSGEPLKGPVSRPDRASSALGARLHRLFGDSQGQPLSLAGVVAVILDRYQGARRQAVQEYISDISDFRRIFIGEGNAASLLDQADSVLASVGSLEQGWTLFKSWLTQGEGTPREELARLVEGDICGAFIKKRGLLKPDEDEFNRLNSCWTGIRVDHLRRIAKAASSNGKTGVIVVAIGENKAKILYEVLRLGLVNELIIDHDLANALSQRYLV